MRAILVVLGIALLGVLIAGLTFIAMRRAAAQAVAIDRRLRPGEARTGRCGACDGTGTRLETRASWNASLQGPTRCWRCGGTGVPPAVEPISGLAVEDLPPD